MQFEAKVYSDKQEVVVKQITGISEEEASRQLKNQGYVVLSIKPLKPSIARIGQANSKFPLLLFSHELYSLLKAGLSLMDSMETLKEKEHRPYGKAILTQVMNSLYEGLSLSVALEQAQGAFPPLYIALIRSSEKTGNLPEALKRYVDYQMQVDVVRKKIISASIYPIILMLVGGLVILFLMLYVVPKFSEIFEAKGDQLPWMSMLLLSWGRMLHHHADYFILGALVLMGGLIFILSRATVRQFISNAIFKLPFLSTQIRIYQLSRFYRTLGMLLRGGIPITQAIEMVSGLLQTKFRLLLDQAAQAIKEGVPTSHAMETHQLTTPVAVRMMRVGEQSGQMGEMMENIGNFYDEEVDRWVDWFTRLFEPLLMVFIGLVIGVIVVLMYMPIFELAGSIQ